MAYWLFKEEPSYYSFERLLKDGKTIWDGVENNLALKHLRKVRKGDKAFFYHTGGETAIVGIISVVSDPYPDPAKNNPKLVVVDIKPERKLPRPVALSEMKSNQKFARFDLVRLPRLSIMPVPDEIWNEILSLGNEAE